MTVVDDDGETWGLEAASKVGCTCVCSYLGTYMFATLFSLNYRPRSLLMIFEAEARGPDALTFKSPSLQEGFGMECMLESIYGKHFEL